MICKGCKRDVGWAGNLTEGLCHQCWRDANPSRSCDKCEHAEFGFDGEECVTTIKCKAGIACPLDAYEPKNVPEKCDKQVLKVKNENY